MEEHYLTVGQLKDKLSGLPDETPVYYQHIEDSYLWRGGWKPIKILDTENSHNGWKVYDYHHRAFTAYQDKYRNKKILIITAHY